MSEQTSSPSFLLHLRKALETGGFVELILTQPTSAQPAVIRAMARLVHIKGTPQLSFTLREEKRDTTRNLPLDEGIQWIEARLGCEFRSALLRTITRDWQLHFPAKGPARLVAHKASKHQAPSRSHDREKATALGDSANDWLTALDILDATGRPRASLADKLRQITRYTEILRHLLRDCGWAGPPQPDAPLLKLADMGAGKGYLTFAAWHLLHRELRCKAVVVGVEARADLVANANQAARSIRAEGLEFIQGDIAHAILPRLDALIALHACNTATDDALLRGIRDGARLILVAPCCHQALRPELGQPEVFAALLRHGLLKERLAEWLTDGLRTLFLEWAGYRVKVIEFVASEHTAKNLMLAAIREHPPFRDASARERILQLKQFFGIQHHALDELLNSTPS